MSSVRAGPNGSFPSIGSKATRSSPLRIVIFRPGWGVSHRSCVLRRTAMGVREAVDTSALRSLRCRSAVGTSTHLASASDTAPTNRRSVIAIPTIEVSSSTLRHDPRGRRWALLHSFASSLADRLLTAVVRHLGLKPPGRVARLRPRLPVWPGTDTDRRFFVTSC